MLRLVPITWQRTERLISLGQIYRAPPEGAPRNLKERTMLLTDAAIALARDKVPTLPHPSSSSLEPAVRGRSDKLLDPGDKGQAVIFSLQGPL